MPSSRTREAATSSWVDNGFEAQTATVTVNQVAVPGDLYRLQNWVPWLGRSLCSAHVARGEILVDRPGPGRGWMVPPGA